MVPGARRFSTLPYVSASMLYRLNTQRANGTSTPGLSHITYVSARVLSKGRMRSTRKRTKASAQLDLPTSPAVTRTFLHMPSSTVSS
jgi:hypothetical protein